MSTSYPFLAVARRYSVSYGAVLSYVDYLEKTARAQATEVTYWEIKAATELLSLVQTAALTAWNAERLRRESVKT